MTGDGVAIVVEQHVRIDAPVRGTRIWLGARPTRDPAPDTSAAELTAFAGGGLAAASAPPSRVQRRRRSDDWLGVRAYLDALTSLHRGAVTHATPPVLPDPSPPNQRTVRRDLRAAAADGIPAWRVDRHLEVAADARRRSDAEVARRAVRRGADHAAAQQDADAWWAAVRANEPSVVRNHLGVGLARTGVPAAVTAVIDDTAHLVLSALTAEVLIGPREPLVTDDGRQELRRITKPRRHALYEAALSSAVLAAGGAALALAPGLGSVTVAVICPGFLGGPAVLLVAWLPRAVILPGTARRIAVDAITDVGVAGGVVVDRGDRTGALRPLDADEAGVADLLAAVGVR